MLIGMIGLALAGSLDESTEELMERLEDAPPDDINVPPGVCGQTENEFASRICSELSIREALSELAAACEAQTDPMDSLGFAIRSVTESNDLNAVDIDPIQPPPSELIVGDFENFMEVVSFLDEAALQPRGPTS